MSTKLDRWVVSGVFASTFACAIAAQAGSHLWEINEIFSNYDGTIQFIELKESLGAAGEIGLAGHELISVSTGNMFLITANLVPPTSNMHLLFGTPAFAALPGAPTPNYIIPAGFFNPNGDTIDWEPTLNYDTFTFTAGQLPIDGINSIRFTSFIVDTFVIETNSPTNYAGQSGTVNAGPPAPAMSTIGFVVALVGLIAIAFRVVNRKGISA